VSDIGPREGDRKVEGRGEMAEIQPEEFALHPRRIGGVTEIAADGLERVVMQREGVLS